MKAPKGCLNDSRVANIYKSSGSNKQKAAGQINNRLNNVHPGDVLHYDFGIGEDLDPEDIAEDTGIEAATIEALVHREIAVDADIDLRLGRYFRLPDGFFLRMQNDYDLEAVHNKVDEELIKITPRWG